MNYFVIDQKLPSLNEYIAANRRNPFVGAKFKKEIEDAIGWDIRTALAAKTLHKVDEPAIVHFEWHERTRKRDADNIASAKKYILDAMVTMGILQNDSRKFVVGFYDTIVDDKKDFVIVRLLDAYKTI